MGTVRRIIALGAALFLAASIAKAQPLSEPAAQYLNRRNDEIYKGAHMPHLFPLARRVSDLYSSQPAPVEMPAEITPSNREACQAAIRQKLETLDPSRIAPPSVLQDSKRFIESKNLVGITNALSSVSDSIPNWAAVSEALGKIPSDKPENLKYYAIVALAVAYYNTLDIPSKPFSWSSNSDAIKASYSFAKGINAGLEEVRPSLNPAAVLDYEIKNIIDLISAIRESLRQKNLLNDAAARQLDAWELEAKSLKADEVIDFYKKIPSPSDVVAAVMTGPKINAALNLAINNPEMSARAFADLDSSLDALSKSLPPDERAKQFIYNLMLGSIVFDPLFKEYVELHNLPIDDLPRLKEAIKQYSTARSRAIVGFQNAMRTTSVEDAQASLNLVIGSCISDFGSTKVLDGLIDFAALGIRGYGGNPSVRDLVPWLARKKEEIARGIQLFNSIGGSQLEHLASSASAATINEGDLLVPKASVSGAYAQKLNEFSAKATLIDYILLGRAVSAVTSAGIGSPQVFTNLLDAQMAISAVDPYLAPAFMLTLVPKMLRNAVSATEFEQLLLSSTIFFRNLPSQLAQYNVPPQEVRENIKQYMLEAANDMDFARAGVTKGDLMEDWPKPGGLDAHRRSDYYLVKPPYEGYETHWFPGPGAMRPQLLSLDPNLTGVAYDPLGLTMSIPLNVDGAVRLYDYLDSLLNPQRAFTEFKSIPAAYRLRLSTAQDMQFALNKMQSKLLAYLSMKEYSGEPLTKYLESAGYSRYNLGGENFERKSGLLGGAVTTPTGQAQTQGLYDETDFGKVYRFTGSASGVPSAVPIIGSGNIHSANYRFEGTKYEGDESTWREDQYAYLLKQLSKGSSTNMLLTWRYVEGGDEKSQSELAIHFFEKDGTRTTFVLSQDDYTSIMNYLFGERDSEKYIASIKYLHETNGLNGFAIGGTMGEAGILYLRNYMKQYMDSKTVATQNLAVGAFRPSVLLPALGGKAFITYRDTILAPAASGDSETVVNRSVEAKWIGLPKSDSDWGALAKAFISWSDIEKVGGGFKAIYESPHAQQTQWAVSGSVYHTTIAPFVKQLQLVDSANRMAETASRTVVDACGWKKDKADEYGWLVAAQYLHMAVSQYTELATANSTPEQKKAVEDYGRLVVLGWTGQHSAQLGFEKMPGWSVIDQELNNLQTNMMVAPQNAQGLINGAVSRINAMNRTDLYRFAINYAHSAHILSTNYFEKYDKFYSGVGDNLAFLTDTVYLGVSWQMFAYTSDKDREAAYLAYGVAQFGVVDTVRLAAGPVFTKDDILGAAAQLLIKIKGGEIPVIFGVAASSMETKNPVTGERQYGREEVQFVLSTKLIEAYLSKKVVTAVYVKFDANKGISYLYAEDEYKEIYGQAGATFKETDIRGFSNSMDLAIKVGKVDTAKSASQTSFSGALAYSRSSPSSRLTIGVYGARGVYGYLLSQVPSSDMYQLMHPVWPALGNLDMYNKLSAGAYVTYTWFF